MELVMFDANALRNRDILEWAVFGQLRELMGAHALRVAVTEVVLAEVVANRQRDIDADLSEFNALAQNSVLRHLSGEDVTHARELATEEREELASSVGTISNLVFLVRDTPLRWGGIGAVAHDTAGREQQQAGTGRVWATARPA